MAHWKRGLDFSTFDLIWFDLNISKVGLHVSNKTTINFNTINQSIYNLHDEVNSVAIKNLTKERSWFSRMVWIDPAMGHLGPHRLNTVMGAHELHGRYEDQAFPSTPARKSPTPLDGYGDSLLQKSRLATALVTEWGEPTRLASTNCRASSPKEPSVSKASARHQLISATLRPLGVRQRRRGAFRMAWDAYTRLALAFRHFIIRVGYFSTLRNSMHKTSVSLNILKMSSASLDAENFVKTLL